MLINFQNSCKFKLETNGINWKGVVVSTRGPIWKRISSWLSLHIGRRWLEWRWLRLTERLAAIFRILRLDAEIRHRYYIGETMTFQQSRGWSAVHRHLLGTTTLSQFLEFCPCDRSNLHNFASHLFYSILFYSILCRYAVIIGHFSILVANALVDVASKSYSAAPNDCHQMRINLSCNCSLIDWWDHQGPLFTLQNEFSCKTLKFWSYSVI